MQLNLATYEVDVINTTRVPQSALTVSAKVYSLKNALLFQAEEKKDINADSSAASLKLDLAPYLMRGMVLVKLELTDGSGTVLSQNLYWLGERSSSYRELNSLPAVLLQASATSHVVGDMVDVSVLLENQAANVSLENKLTLISGTDKARILPAYYSDNYTSLLPGEKRTIKIDYPLRGHVGAAQISMRGWNAVENVISVTPEKDVQAHSPAE